MQYGYNFVNVNETVNWVLFQALNFLCGVLVECNKYGTSLQWHWSTAIVRDN